MNGDLSKRAWDGMYREVQWVEMGSTRAIPVFPADGTIQRISALEKENEKLKMEQLETRAVLVEIAEGICTCSGVNDIPCISCKARSILGVP